MSGDRNTKQYESTGGGNFEHGTEINYRRVVPPAEDEYLAEHPFEPDAPMLPERFTLVLPNAPFDPMNGVILRSEELRGLECKVARVQPRQSPLSPIPSRRSRLPHRWLRLRCRSRLL